MTADEILREAYRAPVIYRRTPEEIRCQFCGRRLKTYYKLSAEGLKWLGRQLHVTIKGREGLI